MAILLQAIGPPAHAADADTKLDTVVVTGSKIGDFGEKSGIPLEQVPQSIQVIGQEDLLDRNARSIGDVLKTVPSATVGAPRTSTYQAFSVKIRGFSADQMRNGMRQRYYSNIDPSATSNIERVEVLKGPSAVLYGGGAIGGIVSIITKRPQHEFGGSFSVVAGSYDQKAASFDLTGPISQDDGLYFRFTGEVERSGTYIDHADVDRNNVALSATWEASDAVTAYFVGEYSERDTVRMPGLPVVGTLVSNGIARIPSDTFLGEPSLHAFKPRGGLLQSWVEVKLSDAWALTPRFSYATFDASYNELFVRTVAADNVTVNRTGRHSEEPHRYPIGQLDLSGAFAAFGKKHSLLLGVERAYWHVGFIEQTMQSPAAIDALNPVYGAVPPPPYPLTTVQRNEFDSWSFYVQDRIDLTDRWNVIAGARADWYTMYRRRAPNYTAAPTVVDDDVDHQLFQLGSTYQLGDGWSVFGSYATGFSIEATAAGRSFDGTPFDPDESRQIEIGVRYGEAPLSASASLFQINRTNVVTADPRHAGFSIQTGDVRARGAELEGTWQIAEGFAIQGGYAYTDSEVVSSNSGNLGFQVADTPKHRANLFARYDLPVLPVELRAIANYVGNRAFADTANVSIAPGLLANKVRLPSYTTVDLGATYRFDRSRLDLALTNVLDELYYTRDFNNFSVIPGEPRQASLRYTVGF